MRQVTVVVLLTAVVSALASPDARQGAGGSVLGVAGPQFTVDGQERFLLGVSLFDALGPTPPSGDDLETLARWGVGIVRVWAHWREPIYARDGSLTPQGRHRLEALLDRLGTRGLMELVLFRPGQLPGQRFALFESPAARLRAAREIATALRGRRNVLFDLYNEHDHRDGPITHAEARALRDVVKAADPDRLVTISSTERHLVNENGALDDRGRANLSAEAGSGAASVHVDVLSPHLPRTDDWAAATASRVTTLRNELVRLNVVIPVYLNEEHRAEPGRGTIPAAVYLAAAAGAREAGAAGWVFHTPAGYALSTTGFVRALGAEERRALEALRR